MAPLLAAGLLTAAAPAAQAATLDVNYAYVYADKPSEPVGVWYRPRESRNHNTSGLPNSVRREGVGDYWVHLPGLGDSEANRGVAHVTAYGDTASHCLVAYTHQSRIVDPKTGEILSTAVDLRVRCFDTSGARLDSEFTASWTRAAGWGGGLSDFAYLTSSDDHQSHEPPANQQFNSMGYTNKVNYLGTGRYKVDLSGMGNKGLDPKAEKGHVQVTAYFEESHRCKVAYFHTFSESTQVEVNCYNADGVLSDSRFTVTYARDANLVWNPWGAYTWIQGGEVHPDEQWTYPDDSPGTTVTRGVGSEEGRYWVSTPMNGFMDKGNVHVTAEGPGAHHCKVAEWNPDKGIRVRCFTGTGEPVRNPFLVSFAL
ncbi:hypothetical protein [Micromonospora endolithica]|uniref:Secreted protein n=1 Tax=Micromonospora endolithica TaxID=230091 RepID=A0A3A9ZR74_9ACTN|nr:hypothetical protein [Micromonospora endolithica]RKN50730.1 hypothetical protein D7223_02920 [Micromonospora endolithica]